MAKEIDAVIKAEGGTFYNKAHFIREAIRLKLEEIKQKQANKHYENRKSQG